MIPTEFRLTRIAAILARVAVVSVIGFQLGCSPRDETARVSTVPKEEPSETSRFARTETYGKEFVFRTPDADVKPKHSKADALEAAQTHGDHEMFAKQAESIEVAFAQLSDGPIRQGQPSWGNRPVWLVIYHGVEVTSSGPVPVVGKVNHVFVMNDADGTFQFALNANPDSN